jgi:hypothetical protein
MITDVDAAVLLQRNRKYTNEKGYSANGPRSGRPGRRVDRELHREEHRFDVRGRPPGFGRSRSRFRGPRNILYASSL